MLGLVAIVFTEGMVGSLRLVKALIVLAAALLVFAVNYVVMKKASTRILSGLTDHGNEKKPAEHINTVGHDDDGVISAVIENEREKEDKEQDKK